MQKKVILIAGATSMNGRACAHLLAKEENQLILLGKNAINCLLFLADSRRMQPVCLFYRY